MIVNELLDRPAVEILWDYNHLKQPLHKADFLFVMCSYNLDIANYAHILFQQKMGEKIVLSGGIAHTDDLLNTDWDRPEAHVFKDRLVELGMAESNIIIEDKATNTGENVLFTKTLLAEKLPEATTGLIVQKPYMERRAYATAMKQWRSVDWRVTSPNISYQNYVKNHREERLINIIVGDTWRIKEYAKKEYQIAQDMPEHVEDALEKLINRGYTKHINK
jgi:uncharacterized SAM-binding protein YcdF (DUF218 family)